MRVRLAGLKARITATVDALLAWRVAAGSQPVRPRVALLGRVWALVRPPAAWWLEALSGCLERARVQAPAWLPEPVLAAVVLAGLLALDVAVWRWLPR